VQGVSLGTRRPVYRLESSDCFEEQEPTGRERFNPSNPSCLLKRRPAFRKLPSLIGVNSLSPSRGHAGLEGTEIYLSDPEGSFATLKEPVLQSLSQMLSPLDALVANPNLAFVPPNDLLDPNPAKNRTSASSYGSSYSERFGNVEEAIKVTMRRPVVTLKDSRIVSPSQDSTGSVETGARDQETVMRPISSVGPLGIQAQPTPRRSPESDSEKIISRSGSLGNMSVADTDASVREIEESFFNDKLWRTTASVTFSLPDSQSTSALGEEQVLESLPEARHRLLGASGMSSKAKVVSLGGKLNETQR
jgi:hypothetical protein